MNNAEFSVTPEELIQKADSMESAVWALKENYDELNRIVEKTRGYWNGEGGNSFRRMFADRQNEIEEMLGRMMEHPEKLLEIVGIDRKKENDIEQ